MFVLSQTFSHDFLIDAQNLILIILLCPPTSEEVEGAYWFGSVRPVVCSQSVMRE